MITWDDLEVGTIIYSRVNKRPYEVKELERGEHYRGMKVEDRYAFIVPVLKPNQRLFDGGYHDLLSINKNFVKEVF